MDDGKEDVNILDLAASEVNYNFIGLFDKKTTARKLIGSLGSKFIGLA